MENKLSEIAEWFSIVKAPDLKEKIDMGIGKVNSGALLEDNWKKLFGFMLFSYSMNHGPSTFLTTVELAAELGVTKEFTDYAADWINHSKSKSIDNGK